MVRNKFIEGGGRNRNLATILFFYKIYEVLFLNLKYNSFRFSKSSQLSSILGISYSNIPSNTKTLFHFPLLCVIFLSHFIYIWMKGRYSKESSGQLSGMQQQFDEKNLKKLADEYKCGKNDCGKFYHSYTAFYNHCKKSHEGQFPPGSLHNGKIFEGPSKNRGRPRIKKIDVKDSVQIQSLKTQNELIQFLGTLTTRRKKAQELIVYVEDPVEQLDEAIGIVNEWSNSFNDFLEKLKDFNGIVTKNDLPEFYDPIEISTYTDKLDSYNFTSIFTFFMNPAKFQFHQSEEEGVPLLQKILVAWLSRILSSKLLAEVIYTLAQMNANIQKIIEKEYFVNKSGKFKNLVDKYFECLQAEYTNKVE